MVNKLVDLIRAGYSGIWLESYDPVESVLKIKEAVVQLNKLIIDGVITSGDSYSCIQWTATDGWSNSATTEPPILQFHNHRVEPGYIYVLLHFHKFLGSPDILSRLLQKVLDGESVGATYIVVVPVGQQIPPEIEHRFHILRDTLPTVNMLFDRARLVSEGNGFEFPESDYEKAARAAIGLTLHEAENAFAMSLIKHRKLDSAEILDLKVDSLRSSAMMDLHYRGPGFESLGGLDQVKEFCKKSLTEYDNLAQPRGVFLLGVPGAGKSTFCRALGVETGRPVISVNLGNLYGSLVGQTEQNVRRVLATVDSLAPCIFFIDEVEKALSGVQSSGRTDSGVSARVFGTLLTWLADHTTDVYTVVTCNDITKLPPEFSRSERFDAIFFFDLPTESERLSIWKIYVNKYQLSDVDFDKCVAISEDWTGAEIKTCCRLARMLHIGIDEASKLIVPITRTMSETLTALRDWAKGRCLHASLPGVYAGPVSGISPKGGRKIAKA